MKFLLILLFLTSCESITQIIDGDGYFKAIDNKSKKQSLSLIFTHNINGELEPCGCRHYPLGGLSQVAGFFYENEKEHVNFYIDTGDTFFPSPKIPASMKKSLEFTAKTIAEGLDQLGLKYFLPGDQDFAGGLSFLQEIANKHRFKFLITNLKDKTKLKHEKIGLNSFGNRELVFLGVIDPSLMNNFSNLFIDPELALGKIFTDHPEYKNKTIIVMSHLGMEADKKLAQKFPFISWIIGSHSQSFLKEPVVVKNTKITQVLSRNHYLGTIDIKATNEVKEEYNLVEMRQKWAEKLNPNPFISMVQNHRTEIKKIQDSEQDMLISAQGEKEVYKSPTYASCIECHKDQKNHWYKTAHALAFQTLRQNQADSNPQCIGCHSLGYQKETGFLVPKNIVQFKADTKNKEEYLKKYMAELDQIFKSKKSIREMKNSQRVKLSEKWAKLDSKYGVTHNFSNVQCLNCHTQTIDHPFEDTDNKPISTVDTQKCLSCHTADQSPKWYKNTHPPQVDDQVLKTMLPKIACPKKQP